MRLAGAGPLLALALLAVPLGPARATAAEPSAVGVLVGRGAGDLRSALEELATRHGRRVTAPAGDPAALAAAAASAAATVREQGKQATVELKKLYYAGQAAAGVTRADALLVALADRLSRAGAFAELGELLLWRAVVLVRAGRIDDGRAAVARLLDLGTSLPAAGLLPPEVARVLEEGRRAAESRPLRRLRIETVPAGAEVTVNGRAVGQSPVEEVLPAGAHDLLVTRPGHRPAARRVELQPLAAGQPADLRTEIALELAPVAEVAAELPGWLGRARSLAEPALVAAFARVAAATQVLVAEREGEGPLVVSLHAADGGRRASVSVTLTGDTARDRVAVLAAGLMLFGPTLPAATAVAATPAPLPREVPLWKRWWLWTAVAVVVAGGVATGAALGATRSSGYQFRFR